MRLRSRNGVQYGLSASIYTQDVNRAFAAMRDLDTGIFYVNAPTIGAEVHLPFGGTKATGNGHREAGTAALDVFSEWKSVYVDFSGKLQRAQIDTGESVGVVAPWLCIFILGSPSRIDGRIEDLLDFCRVLRQGAHRPRTARPENNA